jgi:hypothetical protein
MWTRFLLSGVVVALASATSLSADKKPQSKAEGHFFKVEVCGVLTSAPAPVVLPSALVPVPGGSATPPAAGLDGMRGPQEVFGVRVSNTYWTLVLPTDAVRRTAGQLRGKKVLITGTLEQSSVPPRMPPSLTVVVPARDPGTMRAHAIRVESVKEVE